MELSFPEIFETTIVEVKVEHDLCQMNACEKDISSKLEKVWHLHNKYWWVQNLIDSFHTLNGNKQRDNFVSYLAVIRFHYSRINLLTSFYSLFFYLFVYSLLIASPNYFMSRLSPRKVSCPSDGSKNYDEHLVTQGVRLPQVLSVYQR